MFSINGVPLDNTTYGWRLKTPSQPLSEISRRSSALRIPGWDGLITVPSDADAPVVTIVVRTLRTNLETLFALMVNGGLLSVTADATRNVAFEYLSSSLEGSGPAHQWVDAKFLLRLNGVYWRDTSTAATTAVSLASSSVTAAFWTGISAPVNDAMVRVLGACTVLRVQDTGGSWFTYSGTLTGSQYLRFESATGQAYITTTNVWVGGTEVTGSIDFDNFRITPNLISGSPSNRNAQLTVTTATRSGASIQVNGKAAYIV